ncbi:MAG: hypothetical protein NE328_18275 [Lentisphaeraceae bacterium]|nr:hypothetical protein [Lentisphaeraceae bacterium]
MKLLFIFLTTVLLNTGCLTGALTSQIRQQEEVGREWRDVTLKGKASGLVQYNNRGFEKYEFCGFHKDSTRILEVLIPVREGKVLLREHREYLLEGDLPLVLESGFGLESIFKGRVYNRVNFEGELINVGLPELTEKENKELGHNNEILPQLYNPQGNDEKIESLQEALEKKRISQQFYRPEGSGEKWYLMTTRIEQVLSTSKRSGTSYFLSTAEKSYIVNPDEIDFDQRSWVGNKLLKSAYIITVPVDVVISPVIFIGVLGYVAVVNIFK